MRQYIKGKTRRLKKLYHQLFLTPESAKTLLHSHAHAISEAQIHPVIRYHRINNIKYLELDSNILMSPTHRIKLSRLHQCEIILLQSPWNASPEWIDGIKALKTILPKAKLIYMDWFAPLHIPQPELLEHCDLYLKKQIPKDTTLLTKLGFDTNLEKYESQWGNHLLSGKKIDIDPKKT